WREQEWVTKYGCEWIESRCHMLNVCMTYWGHKFIYNKEELNKRLIQAGFDAIHISEQKYCQSSYKELQNLDTRVDSMFFDVKK
ncbi:MAG TPA: hypothetical protein VKR58_00980, partial [Aquella sp.]|nr:hypothetical protein [Aquella sp.]